MVEEISIKVIDVLENNRKNIWILISIFLKTTISTVPHFRILKPQSPKLLVWRLSHEKYEVYYISQHFRTVARFFSRLENLRRKSKSIRVLSTPPSAVSDARCRNLLRETFSGDLLRESLIVKGREREKSVIVQPIPLRPIRMRRHKRKYFLHCTPRARNYRV